MSKTRLKLISESENCTIYSILFDGDNLTEFEKFISKFKDNAEFKEDFYLIITFLTKFLERGAIERYFRTTEGKFNDNVAALPIYKSKLRLYCLRMSDKIVILGNGGQKNTATYEESEELTGYVVTLQHFEKLLNKFIKERKISINQLPLSDILDKDFNIE